MSEKLSLSGTERTDFGKGAARKLRLDAQIPAVVYGKGEETVHVALPARELARVVRHHNALIDLDVDGKNFMVLTRDVQRNVVTRDLEHVDLLEVRQGDTVHVNVDIRVEGEQAPGNNASLEHATIALDADVTNIPEFVTVNIEDRKAGEHAVAADVELPAGATLAVDESQLVVNISAKRAATEADEETEEATATETEETSAE